MAQRRTLTCKVVCRSVGNYGLAGAAGSRNEPESQNNIDGDLSVALHLEAVDDEDGDQGAENVDGDANA